MKKFLFVILLIVFDFISKKIIFNLINLNSLVSIIPILDIAHIHNYGIAFGLFSGILPSWFIIIIGFSVSILIFYIMVITSNRVEKWGYIFIISGAISNTIDRSMNNYVLDFIYLHYKDFYWPAFNFADIYITFGVLIIFYQVIMDFKNKKNDSK